MSEAPAESVYWLIDRIEPESQQRHLGKCSTQPSDDYISGMYGEGRYRIRRFRARDGDSTHVCEDITLLTVTNADPATILGAKRYLTLVEAALPAMTMSDRIQMLRSLGAILRTYAPVAADELESYTEGT